MSKTVDFDSEAGDAWYSMVRTRHLAGRDDMNYTRPPMDASEAKLAREVNSYAFRLQYGYGSGASPDAIPGLVPTCDRCGSTDGPLVIVGAVYTRGGRIDRHRCKDYCHGGQEKGTHGEARTP